MALKQLFAQSESEAAQKGAKVKPNPKPPPKVEPRPEPESQPEPEPRSMDTKAYIADWLDRDTFANFDETLAEWQKAVQNGLATLTDV